MKKLKDIENLIKQIKKSDIIDLYICFYLISCELKERFKNV